MNKTKSNKEKSCRQVITPKSGNRTGRATPTLFGRVSGCVHFFGAGWSPSPFKGFEAVFGSFYGSSEDERTSGIKSRGHRPDFCKLHLPAVRAVSKNPGVS